MLVGSDNQLSPELKQRIKNEWNWTSGEGSVVDGGHKYSGFFSQIKKSDGKQPAASNFNRNKIPQINHRNEEGKVLLKHLCDWAKTVLKKPVSSWVALKSISNDEKNQLTLTKFLESTYAEQYFSNQVWKKHQSAGHYLALLALLDMWSTDLMQVHFEGSAGIFSNEVDKFKLSPLMNSNGKVIYLDADNSGSNLKEISYHSGGMWTVQLCSNSGGCSNGNGLNLTLGDGKFCVIKDVCFVESDNRNSISRGKSGWGNLMGGGTALWTNVFGSSNKISPYRSALISLIVACFKDVEKVSLIIKTSPTKEKLVAKH